MLYTVQVPQSFDPANYYAQYYRASQETDNRISPFLSAGSANKFNGNSPVVPPHTSQSAQEVCGIQSSTLFFLLSVFFVKC